MTRRKQKVPPPPQPLDLVRAVALYQKHWNYAAVARELGNVAAATVAKHLRPLKLRRPPRIQPENLAQLPIYYTWLRMRRGCRDPGSRPYRGLGARGIRLCEEWRSFRAFHRWSLAHGWRRGRVLLRKDLEGDFAPRNCRWGRPGERRPESETARSRMVVAFGERKSLRGWADDPRCVVSRPSLARRLSLGFPPEDALTLPEGAWPKRLLRRPAVPPPRKAGRKVDWPEVERLVLEEGWSYMRVERELGVPFSTSSKHFLRMGRRAPTLDRPAYVEDGMLYVSWLRLRGLVRKGESRAKGRPARLAPEWEDYGVFREWARGAGYREGLRLIRVDWNGDWTPDNCRFVTKSESTYYRRPPKKRFLPPRWLLEAWGEKKGITAWTRDPRCAIVSTGALRLRLLKGWTPEDAIGLPPQVDTNKGMSFVEITAFGRTQGLLAWSRDRRCKVMATALNKRLQQGIPPEIAITAPRFSIRRRGRGKAGRKVATARRRKA